MNTQPVSDPTDARPLYKPLGLYLKPLSRLHVTVTLPAIKVEGLTVSNWALMEKVKQLGAPTKFISMRVKMSTVDFVRFEAELEHFDHVVTAIEGLNDQNMKIGGFAQPFKVKAKQATTDFPSKNSWTSHFVENGEHYDDTKPGERADTILLKDVPKRFFSDDGGLMPTEDNIRLAFLTFGQIRNIDVPMLNADFVEDTLVGQQGMIASGNGEDKNFSTFSMTGTALNFDFYVQFMDKIGFENCMDEIRDMKIMHMDENGKAVGAAIKVQYDKSKHLSEAKLLAREEARKQAALKRKEAEIARNIKREEEERKLREKERVREAKDKEKEERRLKRQAKRRERRLKKKHEREEKKLKKRIQVEERKLLLAQRKLEATRILEKLFDRVAKMKESELAGKLEKELVAEKKKQSERAEKRREKEEERVKEKARREEEDLEDKERRLKEELLKQVGDKRRAKEAEKSVKDRGDGKERSRDRSERREKDGKDGEKDARDEKRRKYETSDRESGTYERREKSSSTSRTDRDRRRY